MVEFVEQSLWSSPKYPLTTHSASTYEMKEIRVQSDGWKKQPFSLASLLHLTLHMVRFKLDQPVNQAIANRTQRLQAHVFTQDDETCLFSALHPNPKQL
jgi:hypothetical protein